jgi:multidrug efflux pump
MISKEPKASFTDFFITHPVFSWVVNILIVLLGITAYHQLSTRQYPVTSGTQISVRTNMEAPSKVMEFQVTKIIEQALASVQGLETMTSVTEKDESLIKLTFSGRSLDAAASDVREIISRIQDKLPDGIFPMVTKGDVNAAAIMQLALTGEENVSLTELYHIAEHDLSGSINNVAGVASVEVFGGSDYQMNITLDPLKMSSYQVTPMDVTTAIRKHNFQLPSGRLMEEEQEISLITQASLKTPKEFSEIIVAKQEDRVIRIADIGSVNIASADEDNRVFFNGERAVSLSIRPQGDANPIDISKEVRARIETLQKTFPKGVTIHVATDKSLFIKDSIDQVYSAILEAIVLVIGVVFFFLRSYSAAFIPLITIPISLIGSFFIMYTLGFTINVLSLLALVLAIGLVVDDAIVVLENIYRVMEKGTSAFQAAILGTREIRFSVIAMTLTLAAVYAPIAMAPGLVGKVFKEFALTLASAVIISGIVALTLSPMMCAYILKPHKATSSKLFGPINRAIDWILMQSETLYMKGIRFSFQHKTIILLFALAFTGLMGSMMVTRNKTWGLKKELAPRSDEGRLYIDFSALPSKTLGYVSKRIPQIDQLLQDIPEIKNRLIVMQSRQSSSSESTLIPWKDRKRSCRDIRNDLLPKLEEIRGLYGSPFCPSSSIIEQGSGSTSSLDFKLLSNASAEEILKVGKKVKRLLREQPFIERVDPSETAQVPETEMTFNRERLGQLGIDPKDLAEVLQVFVKGMSITRFEKEGRMFPVRVRLNEQFRRSIEDVAQLSVKGVIRQPGKNAREVMIPIRELISFEQKQSDPSISHSMKKRSFGISAELKPGESLGDSFLLFREKAEKILPLGYEIEPSGDLKRFFKESSTIYGVFALAVLFIFLVIAAQFESFMAPFIIIFSVPMAVGGAILTLYFLPGASLNIYSQIGLITLVGLITKHGILLVDFANQQRALGLQSVEAIQEACRLRLRPILMTTLAMVLGALPLATATGAGSEARRQIGAVIVGGMSLGTLFTLFIVPIMYVVLSRNTPKKAPLHL